MGVVTPNSNWEFVSAFGAKTLLRYRSGGRASFVSSALGGIFPSFTWRRERRLPEMTRAPRICACCAPPAHGDAALRRTAEGFGRSGESSISRRAVVVVVVVFLHGAWAAGGGDVPVDIVDLLRAGLLFCFFYFLIGGLFDDRSFARCSYDQRLSRAEISSSSLS